ncbi:F-box protein SKIP19-like [Lolium perenne]|uniref:F-box protein SKIP19-like n=1 Tax=Lolium perenne TaxID=4522 RepID=UPI0021F65099|nr:F-box protein SKIP19-like [Lolium perenne]
MDAAPPPVPEKPPAQDWSLLPLDLLSAVFIRLGLVEVLRGAGIVCRSWLDAAKVPDLWRVVDMENHIISFEDLDVWRARAKAAVDRSDGQLRVFAGRRFVNAELMQYIVERSPLLTTLRLVSCSSGVFSYRLASLMRESPLRELRSLILENVDITVKKLTSILKRCPALEALTVRDCSGMYVEDEETLRAKFARIKTLTFECEDDDGSCCCGCDF